MLGMVVCSYYPSIGGKLKIGRLWSKITYAKIETLSAK
jgi:hypothetical protein